jgi:hypothetical protein
LSKFQTATLAATAALTAGALFASASSAKPARGRAHAHAGSTTVHVVEHALTDDEIPTGGGTDVKGNILTFVNPVFDAADHKRVGHDEGFCTRLDVKQGIWECLWTTFLKGGQITVQGPFYDTHNSVLSVTGGTGAYRNAHGQLTVSEAGPQPATLTFEISSREATSRSVAVLVTDRPS